MNYLKTLFLSLSATCLLFACGSSNDDSTITPIGPDQPNETISGFAKGADIGWVTEYESKGYNFYNLKGEKRECIA